MPDVVVTIPKQWWRTWLMGGDLPGDVPTGCEYMWGVIGKPRIDPGERVYVAANGKLRGYAPLVRIDPGIRGRSYLIRAGGAVAVTIERLFRGFPGFRYRDWDYSEEKPFPDWKTL